MIAAFCRRGFPPPSSLLYFGRFSLTLEMLRLAWLVPVIECPLLDLLVCLFQLAVRRLALECTAFVTHL